MMHLCYTDMHLSTYVIHFRMQTKLIHIKTFKNIYCILCEQIKGFKSSIATILFEFGSNRTVVGYLFNKSVKMTKELYFSDTLVILKYNKTL